MKAIIHNVISFIRREWRYLIFLHILVIGLFSAICFIRKEWGFLVSFVIALIFFWNVIRFFPDVFRTDLKAGIIIMVFTALVGGSLLRIYYPPTVKTMSRYLIPQLNYCLFDYVKRLGFLLNYRFDNAGFKGISPIDISTYNVFLKRNLKGLRQHIEKRDNTNYTRSELYKMNNMFRSFDESVNEFINRYGNFLDEGLLKSLFQIRDICEYQSFYTNVPSSEGDLPNEVITMGEKISNEPMKKVLILIEEVMAKIDEGAALKNEPFPVY